MVRGKKDLTVRERIEKHGEDALVGKISKIIIRQFSESERETFREKAMMALILEIISQEKVYKLLYDEHIALMNENEMLRKKLKTKIRNSKSKIANSK